MSRWRAASRPIQVLTVLLVIAGVALASGVVLSQIQKTQKVVTTPVFLDANCNAINEVNEELPDVPMGQALFFCVGITNGASTDLTGHVHLSAACPVGGVATISNGNTTADDLSGPDGQLPCTVEVAGPSKNVAPGGTAIWRYSVVYSGVTGNYVWTFSAVQG